MDWNAVFGAQDDSLESMLARQRVQNSAVFQIAQELQRRKETDRSFGLQEENARENRALRQSQQQSLDDDRRLRAEDRANAQKTQDNQKFMNSLALRRKGDVVTPEEAVQFTKNDLTGSRVAAGADEHMADPHFHFSGTQATDLAEDRAKADAEQRDIQNKQADERLGIAKIAADAAAARAGSGGSGGLSGNQKQNLTRNLRTEYGKVMAPYIEMRRQLGVMDNGLDQARKGNMNAGTQAVLMTFNKMLDPGSVVRESEYARSPEGMAMTDRINGAIPRLMKGGIGMTPEALDQFADLARSFIANSESLAQRRVAPILMQASDAGIEPDRIVNDDRQIATPATGTGVSGSADLVYDPTTKSFKKAGK